jgi:ABC-type transporter Mla MlaB component
MASGKMLVSGSAAFRRSLIESFDRADWVEMDCSELKDADLTFFQLLCSAHLTATRKNKKFTIKGQYSAAFVTLAGSMGLDRHVGCARDICKSCIWTGGREL